jgi:hypothetical protein
VQWAAGYQPSTQSAEFALRPRASREISANVWASNYPPSQSRIVSDTRGELTVSVIGLCLARDEELLGSFDHARSESWDQLRQWPGSYITVVQQQDQTVVIGDLSGEMRVYMAPVDSGWLWSTAATPLAAYTGTQVDLPQLVMDMAAAGLERLGGGVPFPGIQGVPAGSLLRFTRRGHRIEPWYQPKTGATFEDTAGALRVGLLDGASRRSTMLRSIAADLGGVDSGTLVWLTALFGSEMLAVTYVDHPDAQDLPYAEELARLDTRIDHQKIHRDPSTLHYNGLDRMEEFPITDLPSIDIALLGPDRAILNLAEERKSAYHINGVGGDQILCNQVSCLVSLFRKDPGEAIRQARRLARRHRASPAKILARLIAQAATTQAQSLRETAQQVLRREGHDGRINDISCYMAWSRATAAAQWLTPPTAQTVSSRIFEIAELAGAYGADRGLCHDWLEVRRCITDMAAFRSLAADKGITVLTPFLDRQMLRVLELQGHLREQTGDYKPLLRAALPEPEHLPPVLANRKTKGGLDHTVAAGIRHNACNIRQLISSSKLVSAGVLDGSAIHEQTERILAGLYADTTAFQRFIAAEVWLSALDLNRKSWWEEKRECS